MDRKQQLHPNLNGFANLNSAEWDDEMTRYKATIGRHREEAKAALPYLAIVAYPTVSQAATALEQARSSHIEIQRVPPVTPFEFLDT